MYDLFTHLYSGPDSGPGDLPLLKPRGLSPRVQAELGRVYGGVHPFVAPAFFKLEYHLQRQH